MDEMPQPKDIDWKNGYERKQNPYICCLQEAHFISRDTCKLKVRRYKRITHTNRNHKKAGVALLILDKIYLKEYYKRQRKTLHNDQRINPRKRYNNCKYICTQHRIISIYKATANNLKRRN